MKQFDSALLPLLCRFQTSLPLAAVPLWRWFLYNCASVTRHRGKTKRWEVSIQSIDNLAALPTAADQTVVFYLTWVGCRLVENLKRQSCNTKMASGDQAMKRQCGERQASLKPALWYLNVHSTYLLRYQEKTWSYQGCYMMASVEVMLPIGRPHHSHCPNSVNKKSNHISY